MTAVTRTSNQPDIRPEILECGEVVNVNWPGNGASRFHALWLRDNGQDARTRDPSNYQKLITLNDIPEFTRVESAVVEDNTLLRLVFGPDQWTTEIDLDWLWAHRYDRAESNSGLCPASITTWGAEFSHDIPVASFTDAKRDPAVLLDWLRNIDRYGLAMLTDVPAQSEAVLDVIALFGIPRETNYGRYFEIKSVPNPINLAATSLGLQVHTDNPYRDPVPTLQFFGCLRNEAVGGESVVVDGFRAAERLRAHAPEDFELLTKHSVQFDFHGGALDHLRSSRPMIECTPEGQLLCVRFNNRSADAFTEIPFEVMPDFYRAYRRFATLLTSDELQVEFKLRAGSLFVTDNTRVLHGRKSFTGDGLRWMQGAYADKDALRSKIAVLTRELSAK